MTTESHRVVVGASKGIGAEIARIEKGRMTLLARSETLLEAVADEVARSNDSLIIPVTCDIGDSMALAMACAQIGNAGPIDRLYLVVGGGTIGTFVDHVEEDFEATVALNLLWPARVMRHLLKHMGPSSTVVLVNSIAGLKAFPGWGAYCAAKAGLRALADVWRQEFAEKNVRVLSAYPYATDTGFWDAAKGEWDRAKMMTAEQVAGTIVNAVNQETVVEEIRFSSPYGVL